MKRLRPAYGRTRDGQTIVQVHEDERGKPPPAGGVQSAVAPGLSYMEANHSISVDHNAAIPATFAAKVAVMELLIGLVAYDVQLRPLLLGQPQRAVRIEVRQKGISIDWPEAGVDVEPPKFVVRDAEDWKLDPLGLSGPDMDEDSADVYAPNSVLMHRGDWSGTVIIETILSTPSARDALHLAMINRFATEPRDFRNGRRVTLRCYYERQIRITFADVPFSFAFDPTGERQKANEFPLMCFLTVEVPDVLLVQRPDRWETIPRPLMP